MKVVSDLMSSTPSVGIDDYLTKARKILREENIREIYIQDARNALVGYLDITDVLRITDTKSNITVKGFCKDAAAVLADASLEEAAREIHRTGTDSAAVTGDHNEVLGAILLSDIFPVLIERHDLRGTVGEFMKKAVICQPEDDLQKIYTLVIENGYRAFTIEKDNVLFGVVSRSDILRHGRVRKSLGAVSATTPVERIMSTPAIAAYMEDSISDAAKVLVKHDIGMLPVVNSDGRVLGVLSRQEVLNSFFQ